MDPEDIGPAAGHYNDTNRAFLQSLLARGTLTIEEGKKLLAAIFTVEEGKQTLPADVTEEDIDSYISAAAEALSPFDYEIRSTQHQITKKRVYALVNSESDALTQLATICTPEEIAYIRRLLDAIFETYNRQGKEIMAITGLQALAGSLRKGTPRRDGDAGESQSSDKGVTADQVEKLLARLVKEGWLEYSKKGFYSLAPRALIELRSWLVETYNDLDDPPEEWQRIKFCEACKEIITVGERCTEMECNVRLHSICEAMFWRSRQGGAKRCPTCNKTWTGQKFVGEKAVTSTEDYLRGKRRSGAEKRARDEEDAEEEGEEEVEQPVQRRKQAGRGTQAVEVREDEEAEEEEEEERPAPRRKKGRRAPRSDNEDEEDVD